MLKKILCMALVAVMCLTLFAGCNEKASDYTEEEHLARVTERIENRFMTDETEYTGFCVYPLYNENDELKHFLVEFEPFGFVYVRMRDEGSITFLGITLWSQSLYSLSNLYGNVEWSPYTIDSTNSQPFPDTDICWEVDGDGHKISYNKSPYYITQNQNNRKYLLASEFESESVLYVCAIRSDETYVNLISLTEFNVSNGDLSKKQATMYISFIGKPQFSL